MQCVRFALNEGITLSNARGVRKAKTGQSKNKRTVVPSGGDGFMPNKKGFKMTPETAKVIEDACKIFYPDINDNKKVLKNVVNKLKLEYGDNYDDLLYEYIRKFKELEIPLDRTLEKNPLVMIRKAIWDCCTAETNKLDERDAKIKSAFIGVSTGTGNSDDTNLNAAGRKAHATETKNPNQIRKWLNKKKGVTFKQLLNVLVEMSKTRLNTEEFKPALFEKGADYKAYTIFETNSNSELDSILINYFSNSIQSGQQRASMSVTDKTNKKTGNETKQYNYKIVFAKFNHPIEVDKLSLHGDDGEWKQRQVDALIRDYQFEADDAWEAIDNHVTPKGFFVVTTTTPTPTQKMDAKNRRMAQMK